MHQQVLGEEWTMQEKQASRYLMYRTRARYCARMLGPWDGPWASLTLHGDLDTVPMEAEAALPRPARAASPLRGTVWPMSGHLKTRPFFLVFPPRHDWIRRQSPRTAEVPNVPRYAGT